MAADYATEQEKERTWDILRSTGALKEGHFLLARTGLHYEHFFQVALALQHSHFAKILCVALGRVLRRAGVLYQLDANRRFTIVAPMDAGVPVAFWMGEHLNADRILWVNRVDDGWAFRPFIEIDEEDQAIIVDDAILTGGTMASVAEFVEGHGSSIVCTAAIVDRRDRRAPMAGNPGYTIVHERGQKYEPAECPLCEKGLDLVEIPSAG